MQNDPNPAVGAGNEAPVTLDKQPAAPQAVPAYQQPAPQVRPAYQQPAPQAAPAYQQSAPQGYQPPYQGYQQPAPQGYQGYQQPAQQPYRGYQQPAPQGYAQVPPQGRGTVQPSNAPNPRVYINTACGMILAIMKLLSGLAALGLIVLVIMGLTQSRVAFAIDLFRDFGIRDSEFLYGTVTTSARIIYGILIAVLGFEVMNGLGTFFLRTTKHGATPVQIAHIFYAVGSMILFVLYCIGVVLMTIGLVTFLRVTDGQTNLLLEMFKAFPFYFISLLLTVILGFVVLLTLFGYHNSINHLMSQTRFELAQGGIRPYNRYNKLGGQCVRMIVFVSIYLGFQLLSYFTGGGITGFLQDIAMGRAVSDSLASLSRDATNAIRNLNLGSIDALMTGSLIASAVVSAILILKFAMVKACSTAFDRFHR